MLNKRNFLSFVGAFITLIALTGTGFAQGTPKTTATPPAKTSRKLPERDPKTGKFIKSNKPGASKTPVKPKSTRPLPPRDAKGRFIKKGAATPATPASPKVP